jgi:hypothetical protein
MDTFTKTGYYFIHMWYEIFDFFPDATIGAVGAGHSHPGGG